MQSILNKYLQHPKLKSFIQKSKLKTKPRFHLQNIKASAKSFIVANTFKQINKSALCILNGKEEAAYFLNDLQKILGNKNVLFFPSSLKRSAVVVKNQKIEQSSLILRTEVLSKISENSEQYIIVTYPTALSELVITKEKLASNTIEIEVGEEIDIDFLIEFLNEYKFERKDFVFEPGQYSVRGSIVDIFSFSFDYPYRIDFFGEEVESIRTFDIMSQLSKSKYDKISIIPDIQTKIKEKQIPFFNFINNDTLIFADDLHFTFDLIEDLYEKSSTILIEDEDSVDKRKVNLSKIEDIKEQIVNFTIAEFGNRPYFDSDFDYEFNIAMQPSFQKNFNILADNLVEKSKLGYENYILSENEKQLQRITEIFNSDEIEQKIEFTPIKSIIHEGFIDHDLKIVVYTDHQIFERYHRFYLRDNSQRAAKEALTIREINNLKSGDYVVHIDHGIGVFGGLTTIETAGKPQEVIRLIYKNNDSLFVNIHSLHKISKYKGSEGEPPKIYKLGSSAWQTLKHKSKTKVKDIAKKLIKLYAKRLQEKGFAYSHDTYMQEALESSFMYEDTPDQVKSTAAVKADMETAVPMDRLICGDVGFGKTEVAVRAAFKAVADNKQVALLCPTTILAFQHYNTFKDRLKDMPVTVDYISRLKSTKQQKETLQRLEQGKIDIIIGTHRVVSKDVKFKDLGLLIVDEEQKFGVSIKEKLRQLKVNVDTLTLTATPIPRTLQFSLMGARDLSIIQTPPPNRQPIITELHTFNEKIIRNAINYEMQRNGQAFFVHNHKATLPKIEAMLNRLCPNTTTRIAHGSMKGIELEKIMSDFINQEFGVLITTTIIENGLDIPNANTMIINNAQNFGLSDLHQLRGRVGRSSRKAFCYLIAPPKTVLPHKSRRRLSAIENFAEIGSGFNIAMQDLDIRGAGNMLGGEQSGFITDIGFETYKRILEEAMLELKNQEYKELFKDKEQKQTKLSKEPIKFVADCQIITDLDVYFPEKYVQNNAERLKLYRELDNINDENLLQIFQKNILDRFGTIPIQTKELFNVVRLRWLAVTLGIEKIIIKNKTMLCFFISDRNSGFYDSPVFTNNIMKFITKHYKICKMREAKDKLSLRIENIKTIKKAIEILKKI